MACVLGSACADAGPSSPRSEVVPAAPAHDRTAEIVAVIRDANAGLTAADRAEKYAAMKASPFAFYRGTNLLFWRDLGASSQLGVYGGAPWTRTFLGGDLHVENFGAFDNDQGELVYAMDDFDEAVIGDYQLDLWRAAVSIALVARQATGLSRSAQRAAIDTFTEAYLDAMAGYAGSGAEASEQLTASNTFGLLDDFLRDVAASESRRKMLDRWTVKVGGVRRFDPATEPDLAAVSAAVDADVRARIPAYRASLSGGAAFAASYFTVKGVAQRLHAGLGSLGVRRYYLLIEGPTSGQDDDRLLDVKAQGAPTGAPYVPAAAWSQTQAVSGGDQAVRVVQAAKALGYRVDDLLGHVMLADGLTYSVRERSPRKQTFATATLTSATRLQHLAEQWGTLLASQHARADRDWNSAVFAASLDGEIDALTDGDHAGVRALVHTLALDYADQVELDFASFVANF